MRQGPEYRMPIKHYTTDYQLDTLPIPLELVSDFDEQDFVVWIANLDGSYTIRFSVD